MTTTGRTTTTEMTTVPTTERRYAAQDPIAVGDEVADVESYRVGKRRGLGEAIEAVRYVGYTLGRQQAKEELGIVQHDLVEVVVTIPALAGMEIYGQAWTPEGAAAKPMFICSRCFTLCSQRDIFEDLACDADDESALVFHRLADKDGEPLPDTHTC